ncbi:putative LPS assembly protein LptD [Ichthyobacterium seriolicida]|uniref:LPS-assembly protein LptD central domain-containing protein n=1 Tax=Ichthyobacterium seriolicida TaxID=242600 RepID=A0A1J1DZF5_9FLAO|nr:putative LPS assembly protein LptD [Ichthyobacterium seriolicida]BAV95295.1 hypothetical protein JBKA6_1282 [Ichthyobacterium seriolicida]
MSFFFCEISKGQENSDSLLIQQQSIIDSTLVNDLSVEKENSDSLLIQQQSIIDSTLVNDLYIQSKTDSSSIKEIVEYTATDTIRNDVITRETMLYNKASLKYEDMKLEAGKIVIDWKKNTVMAVGILDTLENIVQRPVFTQGDKVYHVDTIFYNTETKNVLVKNGKTIDKEGIIVGEWIKKESDDIIYIRDGKFTTDKKDDPDYYIASSRIKKIGNDKIVTSSAQMSISGVPTPIFVPFGFFPMSNKPTSGIIFPTWGETKLEGFSLQGMGYYFPFSNNLDLTLRGDIHTRGGWRVEGSSNYKLRYKFSGNFFVDYINKVLSEKGRSDYSKNTEYHIKWSHTQDPKSNPNLLFSASVNIASSEYHKSSIRERHSKNFLNNTTNSSVSMNKKFEELPLRLSVNLRHSHNNNTGDLVLDLPVITLDADPWYPFESDDGSRGNWVEKININWQANAHNKVGVKDSLLFTKQVFDNIQNGIKNTLSSSTSIKLFKHINVSPSVNFTEIWYQNVSKKRWDPDKIDEKTQEEGMVVEDKIYGFYSVREFNFSVSFSTRLYGMFKFGKNSFVQAIRHVLSPTISYSYKPDFTSDFWGYQDTFDRPDPSDPLKTIQEKYSRFEKGIYGYPRNSQESNISFGIGNSLESKIAFKSEKDTADAVKKIILFRSLNMNISYNMAKEDFFKWSDLSVDASTTIIKGLDIQVRSTFSPYAIDEEGKLLESYNISNGSLFRLTNTGFTASYRLSNTDIFGKKESTSDKDKKDKNDKKSGGISENSEVEENIEDDDQKENEKEIDLKKPIPYMDYDLPWNINFGYSWNYNIRGKDITRTSTLTFGIDLTFTKWKFDISSGYDLDNSGFSHTNINVTRDLDSFIMKVNWAPIGNSSYNFFIGIKAPILKDIKYEYTRPNDYGF